MLELNLQALRICLTIASAFVFFVLMYLPVWWRITDRLREEERIEEGLKLIRVVDPPRVVHVGPVPIVPGPAPEPLPPIVIGSLQFPRRHPALHRYRPPARARHGLLIGGRHRAAPTPPQRLVTYAPAYVPQRWVTEQEQHEERRARAVLDRILAEVT